MRSVLLAFCLIMVTSCDQSGKISKVEKPFSTVSEVRKIKDPFPNASEVRLFVQVAYQKEGDEPIFSKKNGVVLSDADRLRLEDALRFVDMPDEMAMCFVPHHFFRYFDDKGRQVGEVAVCFCCAGTAGSGSEKLEPKSDEILDTDIKALEALVLDLGESTQVLCN